jgi:hypothetical protein
MGKKICKEHDLARMGVKEKKKKKFVCAKCGEEAAKEKWVCKPKKLK